GPCIFLKEVMMRNISCLGFSAFLVLGVLTAQAQSKSAETRVVRYHTTMADVKYVYGVASPVARLMPGDILQTNTVDAFGNAIQRSGDTLSLVKGDKPLTGPFYIEGAEPGDTLVVKFLDVQVDSKQGVGAFAPGFGALNTTFYTPMLNPPLPERIWFYPVDTVRNVAKFEAMDSKFSLDIPLHPFLGCIGVAAAGAEARSSIVPAEHGGDMAALESLAVQALYLPLTLPCPLASMCQRHATMG